jgi:hypothetical protein
MIQARQGAMKTRHCSTIQRALVLTIGPEIESHGATVLSDGVATLQQAIPNTDAYSMNDLESRGVRKPGLDEDIYLVAHGDDPGFNGKVGFGDKSPANVAKILKEVLKNYGKNGADKFRGRIILEGCHTGVRRYKGDRIIGGSFLDDLLEIMRGDKFFKKALDDRATVAGYLGSAFSTQAAGQVFGSVSVESGPERRELSKKLGRKVTEDVSLSGDEAVVERRWKQH